MLVGQTHRVSVPVSEDTIVQIRENSPYQRTFYFKNWSSVTLSLKIQRYYGGVWTDIGTSFDLGPTGGGSDVVVKNITETEQLRIRGSGGSGSYGADMELDVSYVRFYTDTDNEWTSPVI